MLDSTSQSGPPARSRTRQRILQATRVLIPPLFALSAVLLYNEFHVPRSPMVPRAKEDKKPKPRKPAGKKSKPAAWQPRSQAELDKLRVRWDKEAIADEPEDADFRRQHDTLLRAVVQVAREAALDRSAIAMRVTPRCRTVRCALEICAPTNAVDAVADMLPKVERHDGPLWHELREVEPDGEPATPRDAKEPIEAEARKCRAWVVGFRVDGTKRKDLKVVGHEPPQPEPAKDSTAPQQVGPEPG
jgi:hypothetical protein